MINIKFRLNIIPGTKPSEYWLNQYDEDFTLKIELYSSMGEFTIPEGTTAAIRGTKPDGNGYSTTVPIEDNIVTVSGDKQMTAVSGKSIYEITLYSAEGKELNTSKFVIRIARSALDKDTLVSESVIREFTNVYDKADEVINAGKHYEDYQNGLKETLKSVQEYAESAIESAESARKSLDEICEQSSALKNNAIEVDVSSKAKELTANNTESTVQKLKTEVARLAKTSKKNEETLSELKDKIESQTSKESDMSLFDMAIGSSATDLDGNMFVYFKKPFKSESYILFVQTNSGVKVAVTQKSANFFSVSGTAETEFSWIAIAPKEG